MGLIERQIRKGGNQKLAAPRFLDTGRSPADVVAVVTSIGDAFNAKAKATHEDQATNGNRVMRWAAKNSTPNLLHVEERANNQCVVTWKFTYASIQQFPKQARAGGFWLATVTPHERDSQDNSVEVTLLNWVINQDGTLQNRDIFEWFLDQIAEQLRAQP